MPFSVSYTTRARRPGEQDGREYPFVSDAEFDLKAARRRMDEARFLPAWQGCRGWSAVHWRYDVGAETNP